jgi:hypothetical protein
MASPRQSLLPVHHAHRGPHRAQIRVGSTRHDLFPAHEKARGKR